MTLSNLKAQGVPQPARRKPVLLAWNRGKDSACALHLLLQQKDLRVAALVTTFNRLADRVAMHAIRRALVETQAKRFDAPWPFALPCSFSNSEYEAIMQTVWRRAVAQGIEASAIEEGLSGRQALGDALAGYEQRNNAASIEVHRQNARLARFSPVSPDELAIRQALRS